MTSIRWTWFLYALLFPLFSMAAPDLSRLADLSILSAENGYTFHTLPFQSQDGKRHYHVFVGVPHTAPPPQGYSALFALDGNAALENLSTQTLKPLQKTLPVLVLIGYDTPLRFHTTHRAYDYTPPTAEGLTLPDELNAKRINGGANDFLSLLTEHIQPAVAQLAPLNSKQQTLWGHSYGALFVLHTLVHQPQAFSHYIAADPALWWQQGLWLQHYEPLLNQQTFHGQTLWLLKSEQVHHIQQTTPITQRQYITNRFPHHTTHNLAQRLQTLTGLTVSYRAYPQDTHGSLFSTTFLQALSDTQTPQGLTDSMYWIPTHD